MRPRLGATRWSPGLFGLLLFSVFVLASNIILSSAACSEPVHQADIPEEYPTPNTIFDLNSVTLEQLLTIDGMRKHVARAIISFRAKHPFQRVEDLLNVEGIGEKTYLRMRRFFRVGSGDRQENP